MMTVLAMTKDPSEPKLPSLRHPFRSLFICNWHTQDVDGCPEAAMKEIGSCRC